jgi:hypothetical protein
MCVRGLNVEKIKENDPGLKTERLSQVNIMSDMWNSSDSPFHVNIRIFEQ